MRTRNISELVLTCYLDIPKPSNRAVLDWEREISLNLALAPGDVEPLPLARARARWPDYALCVQVVENWMHSLGLSGLLANSDTALMACRGARLHHDGDQYASKAFCNLFVSEDKGLDLLFPQTGNRISLKRGAAVIFDTCQPHTVIKRGRSAFNETEFAPDLDVSQIFLTWELSVEDAQLAKLLGINHEPARL